MSEFKVLCMKIVNGAMRPGGTRILAHFDCEVRGLRINGCQIMERETGELVITPPLIKSGNGRFRAIKFPDARLMGEFFDAAMDEYRTLKDAEPVDAGLRRILGDAERDSLDMAGI